jgi:hypothetical protein
MNWWRGLVRLWLLVSCIWIVGVGWTYRTEIRTEPSRTYDYRTSDGLDYEITGPAFSSNLELALYAQRHLNPDPRCHLTLRPGENVFDTFDNPPSCLTTVINAPLKTIYPNLWPYVIATIAGPLTVLLAGFAIAWVVIGFRPRSVRRT